jgi:hypothetical protein
MISAGWANHVSVPSELGMGVVDDTTSGCAISWAAALIQRTPRSVIARRRRLLCERCPVAAVIRDRRRTAWKLLRQRAVQPPLFAHRMYGCTTSAFCRSAWRGTRCTRCTNLVFGQGNGVYRRVLVQEGARHAPWKMWLQHIDEKASSHNSVGPPRMTRYMHSSSTKRALKGRGPYLVHAEPDEKWFGFQRRSRVPASQLADHGIGDHDIWT